LTEWERSCRKNGKYHVDRMGKAM